MDLSVGLTTSSSIERIKWLTERSDNLGFHCVWIGEDIGRPQEIFTATSLVLLRTRKATVGIGVTSPLIRNITTLARAAAALDEISPARFRLGLGIGGIQDLKTLGIKVEKPVECMRRTVSLLRTIWKNRNKAVNDEELKVRGYKARFQSGGDIPIFMGVRGPRLLALAAEVADGLILSGPKKYIQESVRLVLDRRAALNLPHSKFTFTLWVPTILLRDRSDLELVRKVVAVVVADTPKSVLEIAGIAEDEIEGVRTGMARKKVEEAASRVSERLIDQFCISGDAENICKSLRDYSGFGIDEVVFGPPYGRDSRGAIVDVAKAWRRAK